jgi:hypothetical protein
MSELYRVITPKNPLLYFTLWYVVGGVLFGFYAWGVHELMERVIFNGRTWDKDNLIGVLVALFTGVVLVVQNKTEIDYEKRKSTLFQEVVLAYDYVISSLYLCAYKPKAEQFTLETPGVVGVVYTTHSAIYETTAIMLASLVLLLYEFSTSARFYDEGRAIVSVFNNSGLGFLSHVGNSVAITMAQSASVSWAAAMLNLAQHRVQRLAHLVVLKDGLACVLPALERAREKLDVFVVVSKIPTFWWIFAIVRVFGILYLLSVPFLLWTTQGVLTILWSLVLYVIFGSVIVYRLFLGNVMLHPTKWDVGPIMEAIQRLAQACDAKFETIPPTPNEKALTLKFSSVVNKYLTARVDVIRHE